jgi:antitoxin MazE
LSKISNTLAKREILMKSNKAIKSSGEKDLVSASKNPEYVLSELLKGVTKENIHAEVDMGGPIGREAL